MPAPRTVTTDELYQLAYSYGVRGIAHHVETGPPESDHPGVDWLIVGGVAVAAAVRVGATL